MLLMINTSIGYYNELLLLGSIADAIPLVQRGRCKCAKEHPKPISISARHYDLPDKCNFAISQKRAAVAENYANYIPPWRSISRIIGKLYIKVPLVDRYKLHFQQ